MTFSRTVPPHHKSNFVTLQRAMANDDVVLVRGFDRETGNEVTAICIGSIEPGIESATPWALLIEGNPVKRIVLPPECGWPPQPEES